MARAGLARYPIFRNDRRPPRSLTQSSPLRAWHRRANAAIFSLIDAVMLRTLPLAIRTVTAGKHGQALHLGHGGAIR